MSTVDVTVLSPEQLIELIVAAKRALYPDARVVDGKLECSQCKKQGIPALVEDGMTVTHDLGHDLACRTQSPRMGRQFVPGVGRGRGASA